MSSSLSTTALEHVAVALSAGPGAGGDGTSPASPPVGSSSVPAPDGSSGDCGSSVGPPPLPDCDGTSVTTTTAPAPSNPNWRMPIERFLVGRVHPPRGTNKAVAQFYEKQRELVEAFERIDAMHTRMEDHRRNSSGGMSHDGSAAAAATAAAAAAAAAAEGGAPSSPSVSLPVSVFKYSYVPASVAAALGAAGGASSVEARDEAQSRQIAFAITASFLANIVLFGIKIFAAIYSGSLAVIASAIDSSLDLVSGSIIYVAARIAARKNPHLYPIGKARLEPLAIIVFASVMGVASLQLMVESIRDIVGGYTTAAPVIRIDEITYGVLAAVIATKAVLYLICSRLADVSASVDALAQDHRNDVITNSVTIAAVLIAVRFPAAWSLDPICAFLLATMIVTTWAATGREYIVQLTGRVADPSILAQLTFLAMRYHPDVTAVDTVRAYHSGSKILAEVDIVLPPEMPLASAHDVGEGLQHFIEAQEYVERAFVHLDTESDHRAEDEHVYM
jgi:cation diffusion facilitator family transporter